MILLVLDQFVPFVSRKTIPKGKCF